MVRKGRWEVDADETGNKIGVEQGRPFEAMCPMHAATSSSPPSLICPSLIAAGGQVCTGLIALLPSCPPARLPACPPALLCSWPPVPVPQPCPTNVLLMVLWEEPLGICSGGNSALHTDTHTHTRKRPAGTVAITDAKVWQNTQACTLASSVLCREAAQPGEPPQPPARLAKPGQPAALLQ